MKYFIILDLEATCWEGKGTKPNEIIEIGAVCIDENKNRCGEFATFVKPTVHTQLSAFCTQLTSITQQQVDAAPLFPDALQAFQAWIAGFGDTYVLCSWGFYDKAQFNGDCLLHKLDTAWLKNHISLKHQHGTICKLQRPMGMSGALRYEKLQLEGTHHRGIDDARNIAKIFLKHFDAWQFGR